MKRSICWAIFSFVVLSSLGEVCRADDFKARLKKEISTPTQDLNVFKAIRSVLKGKRVIIIPGFANEIGRNVGAGSYFRTFQEVLAKDFGVSSNYIPMDSSLSVPNGAVVVAKAIEDVHKKHPDETLILVGHSKGSSEILYALLLNPKLFLDKIVDRALLIQSAIGGSPLAEDEGPDSHHSYLKALEFFFRRGWTAFGKWLYSDGVKSGLPSLAAETFDYAFAQFEPRVTPEQRQEISKKILYVRSFSHYDKVGLPTKTILWGTLRDLDKCTRDCKKAKPTCNHDLNDGIIPVRSQMHPKIGIPLDPIPANHIDLTLEFPVSMRPKAFRIAFTRALIPFAYDEELKVVREVESKLPVAGLNEADPSEAHRKSQVEEGNLIPSRL